MNEKFCNGKPLQLGDFLKGHLKFAILKALEKKQLHGYAIINKIAELTGVWKPTSGSIYPMLAQMQKEKLVSSECQKQKGRKKKVYCITKKGLSELRAKKKMIFPMIERMNKMFQTLLPRETMVPEKLFELLSKQGILRNESMALNEKMIVIAVLDSSGKISRLEKKRIKEKIDELNKFLSRVIKAKN